MEYPNKLLVDCFIRYKGKVLLVKRKRTEKWFPDWYGSLWREVNNKESYHETLLELLKEINAKPKKIELKAVANNIFHDLKETFNVLIFIVDVTKPPKINKVPEGESLEWIREKELMKKEKLLTEYKKAFPKFKKGKIIFYHTEYNKAKILKMKFYN